LFSFNNLDSILTISASIIFNFKIWWVTFENFIPSFLKAKIKILEWIL
jgi:hypothetical protein